MVVRVAVLLLFALAVAGCGSSSEGTPDAGPPPSPEEVDLDGFPCAMNTECAESGEPIEGTCCVVGDSLERVAEGRASEAVSIETDGAYAILCGGFGAAVHDVTVADAPEYIGSFSQRCQRSGFGPQLDDGTRVFYLAHHGDSWVPMPSLRTYHIDPAGTVTSVDFITDTEVLFEGVAYHDGYLYVAAHGGGVRQYSLDDQGIPTFERAITGFDNAWTLDIDGDFAYVADAEGGLRVIDLTDPATAQVVEVVETVALAREVDVADGRAYVAMGGAGIAVFDVSSPYEVVPIDVVDTRGSAQSVSVDGRRLAVANWNHVAMYDAESLHLLGTQRTTHYTNFEQTLGVALVGDVIFAAEWEGLDIIRYSPGYVSSDLWLEEDQIIFDPESLDARAVIVRNRGPIELIISNIRIDGDAFALDAEELRIPPGGADVVELTYQPPGPDDPQSELWFTTNDPDLPTFYTRVMTTASDRLNVGDELTEEFAFLDPSGQLDNLRGSVYVFAYFALF
jgi:hypothetical protein